MTRLAAIVAIATLSACTSGPLEGGRYTCTGSGEDQCTEGWRCGLEGFCHQRGDTTVSWRCAENADCEGAWICGLTPERDAGQCHDPAVANPHGCTEERHCTGGWHCGPGLACYDRTVKASHACRFDAGDCADGWRCGLELRCQDRAVGFEYPCRGTDGGPDDSWCEQGWRCTPEGRCTNPQGDALGATPLLAPQPSEKIHPLGPRSAIERLAVSPVYESGLGTGRRTVAWVQSGQLRARVYDPFSASYEQPLGAWAGRAALAVHGSRGEGLSGPTIKQDAQNRIFLANADGGVEVVTLASDGGTLVRNVTASASPVSRLRVGTANIDLAPRVLGFSDVPNRYYRFRGSFDDWFTEVFREDATGNLFTQFPGNALVDAVTVRPSLDMECVFAVDRRGLWVSQQSSFSIDTWDFEPLQVASFTNDTCAPAPLNGQRIAKLAPHGREWLGVSSSGLDGGDWNVSVIDLRPLWIRTPAGFLCTTFGGGPCTENGRIPIQMKMGPCQVCPGGRVLDFGIVIDSSGQPNAEVRCGTSDGGTAGFLTLAPAPGTTQCSRSAVDGESSLYGRNDLVALDEPVAGSVGWGSSDGYVWTGRSASEVSSPLFDRAATSVAQRGPLDSELTAFTQKIAAVPVAGVGLETIPISGVVSAVAGEPSWVLTDARQVLDLTGATFLSGAREVGVVGTQVTPFVAPHSAVSARSGALTKVVVAVAGNSVFSAEPGSDRTPIELRLVTPSQIDSLAFPAVAPAGVYLRGYAVTPGGVLSVTAETPTRWLTESVALPAALVPREVWFEGSRGRVGFADGTVYSLPSRVPIAPGLPNGVVDYVQVCGQQLALGTTGLHRLESGTGSIGAWKPLTLPVGFADAGLTHGRAHGVGDTVYVFTRTGEAARLAFTGCP